MEKYINSYMYFEECIVGCVVAVVWILWLYMLCHSLTLFHLHFGFFIFYLFCKTFTSHFLTLCSFVARRVLLLHHHLNSVLCFAHFVSCILYILRFSLTHSLTLSLNIYFFISVSLWFLWLLYVELFCCFYERDVRSR